MKFKDLETGDIIEMRCGEKFMVIKGEFKTKMYGTVSTIFMSEYGKDWTDSDKFLENMENNTYEKFDITCVYKSNSCGGFNNWFNDLTPIWKREELTEKQLKTLMSLDWSKISCPKKK